MTALNAAAKVIRTLEGQGFQAFLVGGCVRDLLLNKTPKDCDVTTDAHPEQVQSIFPKTVPVGAAFGVVVVIEEGVQVEVATFRTDGVYGDSRRPDSVAYSASVREDVIRRDFTINGLLASPSRESDSLSADNVVDYVGGVSDLRKGVIRCVGHPVDRFSEDALRMLRAVRFAAQLGFEIELATFDAITQRVETIRAVSRERIAMELFKLVSSPYSLKGLTALITSGLLSRIFPREFTEQAQLAYTLQRFERFSPRDPLLGMTTLLADVGLVMAKDICESLKLSNQQRGEIIGALELVPGIRGSMDFSPAKLKRMARRTGLSNALCLLEQDEAIGKYAARVDHAAILSRYRELTCEDIYPRLFITGDDLIARGLKPSPLFKSLLFALETGQLNGTVNSRAEADAALDTILKLQERIN